VWWLGSVPIGMWRCLLETVEAARGRLYGCAGVRCGGVAAVSRQDLLLGKLDGAHGEVCVLCDV
jgi:hypothetical protein